MDEVSFAVTADERALIERIGHRAVASGLVKRRDRLAVLMDVTATHANGCPLRLADLLAADAFNFVHDVAGITQHIDRDTGRLGNCFRPRCAA